MSEVICPKCGSNQITAQKKGFSGTKAVVGAVLTGGIGLLAGTIGSNKVIITCLNCGNQFKPGQKKQISYSLTQTKSIENKPVAMVIPEDLSAGDKEMLSIYTKRGLNASVRYIKGIRNFNDAQALEYVNVLATKYSLAEGVDTAKGGCLGMILLLLGIGSLITIVVLHSI